MQHNILGTIKVEDIMKSKLATILCLLLLPLRIQAQTEEFETAAEAVKNMKVGLNLTNSLGTSYSEEELDGNIIPQLWKSLSIEDYELVWGNPVTKPELFKMARKAGFNAVRIPVAWWNHMESDGTIDQKWMRRVHEVVDYVIDQNMYCIINKASDCWTKVSFEDFEKKKDLYKKLWLQIAEEFKEYDHHLLFEGYNELLDKYDSWNYATFASPNGYDSTEANEAYETLLKYGQTFVDAVRSTGGNNTTRNLILNTYAGFCPIVDWSEHLIEPLVNMKLPVDIVSNHLIVGLHAYFSAYSFEEVKSDVNNMEEKLNAYLVPKGCPVIISEWGADNVNGPTFYETPENYINFAHYFMQMAKKNNFAAFQWTGPISYGKYRRMPAFESPEHVTAILRGYYGDDYEPDLLTTDDYDYLYTKASFEGRLTELNLYDNNPLNLNEYIGLQLELAEMPTSGYFRIVVRGETEEQQQYAEVESTTTTLTFDKSLLGSKINRVTLQNSGYDGPCVAKVIRALFEKKDGTKKEEDEITNAWGCPIEIIVPRKQFVHNVEYDGNWTELNIFSDDIPLKLKNYKGIRLELAGPLNSDQFHIKIYGDGNSIEDLCPLSNGATTTVTFDTSKFSTEINRITLQHIQEGKAEAKVICAWLIRQDGTEEYSDLSPFRGCEITEKTSYATNVTNQYLVNPSFDSDLHGWTNTGGTAKWREHIWEALNNFCEFEWTGSAIANQKVVQTITLPAGSYRLSVTCASDPGSSGLYLIAGSYSKEMPGTGGVDSFSLDFIVAKESAITIGMKVENTTATWVNFDNFRLEKLETTAIIAPRGVKTKGNNLIYNMWGQRLDKLRKGINIINGKKVIVK